MLDDINKIIPEMDENDSEKMYNNLSKKSVIKKERTINKKLILSLASILLIISLVSIGIGFSLNNSYKSNTKNVIDEGTSDNSSINSNNSATTNINNIMNINEKSIIGIAAYNEFDKQGKTKLTNYSSFVNEDNDTINEDNIKNDENDNNDYYKASYPYDYVKIVKGYKFTIKVNDINDQTAKEIIETNCGLGTLEVVVADFITYVGSLPDLSESVNDTLICIRGYNGYYTILLNSASFKYDYFSSLSHATYVFSSHKKILSDDVSKDFTPPIVTIIIDDNINSKHVYFESGDNLGSESDYNSTYAFENIGEIDTIIEGDIQSILDITKFVEKDIEVTINSINYENKIINVDSNTNLKIVHINETTKGTRIDEIKVGDNLIIKYYELYANYKPIEVIANSIQLINNETVIKDNIE